jgi:hypothetical protein
MKTNSTTKGNCVKPQLKEIKDRYFMNDAKVPYTRLTGSETDR